MRKIAYILLLVFSGMLGSAGAGCAATVVRDGSQCTVTSSAEEQWRCEKACNSDLVLLRAVGESGPVPTQTLMRISCPERVGVKCGIVCGRSGAKVDCFPEFIFDLRVGCHPADYYIRRRHRLII